MRRSFFVHGRPYSFALVANQRGKSYLPARVRKWKKTIERVAKQAGVTGLEGAVRVDLVFCFQTPKSRGRGEGRIQWHTVRPDRDNLTKPVQDSLGDFWGDDCQVTVGETAKIYHDDLEGVLVYVETGIDELEELERMGALGALEVEAERVQSRES